MVVSPIMVGGLIGALLASCLVCVASAAFAWRAAWPIGLRRLATELRERIELVELEWQRAQGQLDVKIENLHELEETVERKRARAAARESWDARKAGNPPGGGQPTSDAEARAQLRRVARAKGYPV